MGFLDNLKSGLNKATSSTMKSNLNKTVNSVVKSASSAASKAITNTSKTFTFQELPKNAEELKALKEAALTDAFATAALTVLALNIFGENAELGTEALNFLKGPEPLSPREVSFIKDRFGATKQYIARSYFKGATPENDYAPSTPYTIVVSDNPHSKLDDTHLKLFIQSGGADSPRDVILRKKPSTGQWFLSEQQLMVDIRIPKSTDKWA